MLITTDMQELLDLFERRQVQYALVGGFAVNYYGYMRTTNDIDILVFPSPENARRIMQALDEFGFGKAGIPQSYFETEGTAIHLGVEPNRIDLLTRLKGVPNATIFANIRRIKYGKISLNLIDFDDLLECKRNSDRPKDAADVDELIKAYKSKDSD